MLQGVQVTTAGRALNAAAEKGTRIHEALEVRDPSALHDEEELEIYEQIVQEEDSFNKSFSVTWNMKS